MDNNKFNALIVYTTLLVDDYGQMAEKELIVKLNEHFSKSAWYPFVEEDIIQLEIEKEERLWANELEKTNRIIKYYGNEGAAELYN